MSAENFVKIFKKDANADAHNAYGAWKTKNRTWLNYNRKELEDMGLSKRVGFALTESTAAQLGRQEEFKKLVAEIKTGKPNRGPFLDENNDTPIVVFPGVPFKGGIERVLDKFLGKGSADKAKELKLVKGHVLGFNTGALLGVQESLLASKGIAATIDKETLKGATDFLTVLIDHLTKLDIESASIKNFESPILAKYSKSSRHFLVELQTEASNSESAKLVQRLAGRTEGAITGIRGVMTPGGKQQAIVGKLLELLEAQGLTDPDTLARFKSSPSLVEMIEDEIVSAISKKPKKLKSKYSEEVQVAKNVQVYVNEESRKEYRSQLNALKKQAEAYKRTLASQKQEAVTVEPIAGLLSLLNARLFEQIQSNMGTGNETKVLNFRSGRFAESARVERISQSRAGMVSAFYSYMRNPYGTFSEGGRQQNPRSRDPKALISKSIREIGATMVGNRMRAVLV